MYEVGILGKRLNNNSNNELNLTNNNHERLNKLNNQYTFRVCPKCNYLKYELDFYSKKECKTCANNPIKLLVYSAKTRAKARGLDFNLELNDLIMPEICPVLGIKIEKQSNHVGPNSPTLDRIDNNKGYVKGNVRIISHKANWLKSNSNPNELALIYQDSLRNNANIVK